MDRYNTFRNSLPPPPGRSAAIAIVTKETGGGLGKTRLLEEIAARCIFDNFVPVLVRNDRENAEAPQNHLEMALQISSAVERTRQHFGLAATPLPVAREFAYAVAGMTPTPKELVKFQLQETQLDAFLRQNCISGPPAQLAIERVLPLIQAECAALRDELTIPGQPAPGVLLLLDDLHRYAGCVQAILPRIRQFGLGRPDIPLPVIFTCYAAEEDKLLEEALRFRKDIMAVALEPFKFDIELPLACRQFILSEWKVALSSRRDKSESVVSFFEDVKEYTGGRPQRFWATEMKVVLNTYRRIKVLVPTNFEEMLAKWK
jgi:hypothetical protein